MTGATAAPAGSDLDPALETLATCFVAKGLPTLADGDEIPNPLRRGGRFLRSVVAAQGHGAAAVWRERWDVLGCAAREAPVIFALLVFLFVTSEVWRFFGRIDGGRFAAVAVLFAVAGVTVLVLVLADALSGVYRTATRESVEELVRAAKEVAAAAPVMDQVEVPEERRNKDFRLNWAQQLNIGLVLSAPLIVIVLLVGAISFGFFVLLGFVGVDAGLADEWIFGPAPEGADTQALTPLLTTGLGGLVLSEELLRVSGFLAAVAAFAFAIDVVREPDLRQELVTDRCEEVRQLVAAWVFYRQATLPEAGGSE